MRCMKGNEQKLNLESPGTKLKTGDKTNADVNWGSALFECIGVESDDFEGTC